MAYIVYKGTGGTHALSGTQYTPPENQSAARLKIRTGTNKGDVLEYGFTTDVSASVYCPIVVKLNGNIVRIGRNEEITKQINTTKQTNTTVAVNTTTQINYTTSTSQLVTNYTTPDGTYSTSSISNYNATVNTTTSTSPITRSSQYTSTNYNYASTSDSTWTYRAYNGTGTTSRITRPTTATKMGTSSYIWTTMTRTVSQSTSGGYPKRIQTQDDCSTYRMDYTSTSIGSAYYTRSITLSISDLNTYTTTVTYTSSRTSVSNTSYHTTTTTSASTRPSNSYLTYSKTKQTSSYYTGTGQYSTSSTANTTIQSNITTQTNATTTTMATTNNFNI